MIIIIIIIIITCDFLVHIRLLCSSSFNVFIEISCVFSLQNAITSMNITE